MKYRNLPIIIVMAFINITLFQNCAPNSGVQFSIDDVTSYSIYGNLPEGAQVVTLKPEESKEYPATQLLLVIDNSATMKQSQEALVEKVDKLLASLSNKLVTVRLLSTSNYANYFKQTYGTYINGVESYVNSYSELNGQTENIIYKTQYGRLTPTSFTINPEDPIDVKNQTITKLKTSILNLGTSGNNNESGLCSVAQYLAQNLPPAIDNEKTVIFLLTDEDNFSSPNHCLNESVHRRNFNDFFSLNRLAIQFSIGGEGYTISDGVNSPVQNLEFKNMIENSIVKGIESSVSVGQACTADDLNYLKRITASRVGRTTTLYASTVYFNSAAVTSCTYVNTKPIFSLPSTGVDYCVNPYNSYPNAVAYFAATFTGVSPNQTCSFTRNSTIGPVVRHSYYLKESTSLADSFLQSMKNTNIGNNYFMSIVTNTKDQSCPLLPGQSYGETFIKMAELSPSTVKTYSICHGDDTFTNAFKEIAAMTSYISQEFDITIPEGQAVRDVMLIQQGNEQNPIKLDTSVYQVSDGKIKFNNIKLSATDSIKVIIF